MKIAYISPYYYPDMIGGMEWYSYHIANELEKLGIETHVITQKTNSAKTGFEIINGVKVHRVKTRGFSHRARLWLGLEEKLKKIKPDIIHSIDYSRSHTWSAQRFGQKNNIPTAITISDIVSQKTPRPLALQIPLEIFDKFFAKKILRSADKLLLRTNWTAKWVLKQKIDAQKIAITPSGLSEEELKIGSAENFEKKFGISKNIILFLGTLREQKGPMLLLEAFKEVKKEIKDAKLVFVGSLKIEHEKHFFFPELEKKIKKDNIKDVTFLGPLFGSDKTDALAASEIMALPSSFENFGQVYIQAMAQLKPVIGSTGGGIPEIVDDKKNGFLIKPWDKKDLIQKLVLLLSDKNLRKKMGQNGREKAQKYRYKTLTKKLIKIYNSIQK